MSTGADQGPLVSIIVPIYNVEQYLADCLNSLVGQTYKRLDIVIINDGSSDGSLRIAEEFAQRDDRISVYSKPNQGLGAARNTGLEYIEGDYVTFVDSDDSLPVDAISTLVCALVTSGSDFAIGNIQRMERGGFWIPAWAKEVHRERRLGLVLDDLPDILKDVYVCNKLFKVEFFKRVIGEFPIGIRYEDQEPTAKAFLIGRFDVLQEVVYNWRIRSDGTSITQQKSNPEDLADRLVVKRRVADLMLSGATQTTQRSWLAKAIGFDLRSYYEQVPRTGVEFWTQLRDGVVDLAHDVDPDIWRLIPLVDRLPAYATLVDARGDVDTLITRRDEYGWRFPGEIRDGRAYLASFYLDGLEVSPPDEILEIAPENLHVVSRITRLTWAAETLKIEGYAYLGGVDASRSPLTIAVAMESLATGGRIGVPLERFSDIAIDQASGDAWNSYADSGFRCELDTSDLLALGERLGASGWKLVLTVSSYGLSVEGQVRSRDRRGQLADTPFGRATTEGRWVVGFDNEVGLSLTHKATLNAQVTAVAIRDQYATMILLGQEVERLQLDCDSLDAKLAVGGVKTSDGNTRFEVKLPTVTRGKSTEHTWTIRAVGPRGRERLTWIHSLDDLHAASPAHLRVRASASRAGTMRLHQNRWWGDVQSVFVKDNIMTVSGGLSAPDATQVTARFVSDNNVINATYVEYDRRAGTYTARVPLVDEAGLAVPRDGYSFRLSVSLATAPLDERWLPVAFDLQQSFPYEETHPHFALTFTRTRQAAALWMQIRPPYEEDERGRLAQRRLHEQFIQTSQNQASHDAALFESYNGKAAADSVLALHNEFAHRRPESARYWSVQDFSVAIPDGATPLLMHSREWMRALHSSKYLVNNNNFPPYFRKSPTQIYIQTWHGTPLKKIANDIPDANLSLPYRDLMVREAEYWDFLLAQNDFAAHVLPAAFDYHGPVINSGYPRNDVLTGTNAPAIRERVRDELGLRQGDLVVLYAPTWRDNATVKGKGYALVQFLDVESAQRELGSDAQFLLRGHANTVRDARSVSGTVKNVTTHPDINELFLASDVLVTDYSSVMFDYCVTGKPILYLVPDIGEYRDTTRGFYLDLEDIAPGPLCLTSDELVQNLKKVDELSVRFKSRYDAFVQRFASSDDGSAAARVADQIW